MNPALDMVRSIFRALACALLLAGCASAPQPDSGPPVVVEVQNNNFQDATVWAIREGERQRLGVVTGKTDAQFEIPWKPNLSLRLDVRFLGGGQCSTPTMLMDPGQLYVLDLQPDLRLNLDCRAPRDG